MSEAHPLLVMAAEVGVKPVAQLLGDAFERLLETSEGEAAFVAWCERRAAERRARINAYLTRRQMRAPTRDALSAQDEP